MRDAKKYALAFRRETRCRGIQGERVIRFKSVFTLTAESRLLKAAFTLRAVFSGRAPTDPLKIHHVSLTAFRADTLNFHF